MRQFSFSCFIRIRSLPRESAFGVWITPKQLAALSVRKRYFLKHGTRPTLFALITIPSISSQTRGVCELMSIQGDVNVDTR
jgi:hypothetical protein